MSARNSGLRKVSFSCLQRDGGLQSFESHLPQDGERRRNSPSSLTAGYPDAGPAEARVHRPDVGAADIEQNWATVPRRSGEPPAERAKRLSNVSLPEEVRNSTGHRASGETERISRTSPALSVRVRARGGSSDEEESFWEFDFEDDWFLQDCAEEASASQARSRPPTASRGAKETMEEMRVRC